MKVDADHLSNACTALGEIMHTLAGRRLLAKGIKNHVIREKMESDLRTDAELERVAAQAFERAAIVLAEIGYPGATMHTCNPTEQP